MDAQPERGIIIAPMSVGEVVDSGFTLARRNFRHLAQIGAWGIIAGYALQILFSIPLAADSRSDAGAAASGLGGLVSTIGFGLAGIAMALAYARLVDPAGGIARIPMGEAYRLALTRVPALLGLAILAVIATLFLMLVFPALVYVWVRWANAVNAVVIDRLGPIGALQRSWTLTRRAWWHTAIVLFINAFAIGIVQTTLGAMIGLTILVTDFTMRMPLITAVLGGVVGSVVAIVITPFATAVGVVLYYELRARSEGYDLERRLLLAIPAE